MCRASYDIAPPIGDCEVSVKLRLAELCFLEADDICRRRISLLSTSGSGIIQGNSVRCHSSEIGYHAVPVTDTVCTVANNRVKLQYTLIRD